MKHNLELIVIITALILFTISVTITGCSKVNEAEYTINKTNNSINKMNNSSNNNNNENRNNEEDIMNSKNNELIVTSTAFQHNTQMPKKYTCQGEDINPQLTIENLPNDVESVVIIMDDPDAVKPAGKIWDHWIVFDIKVKGNAFVIKEEQEPSGIHGKGTSGNLNYKGPCPPDGEHRYFFKVYAVNTFLDLPEGSTKTQVEEAMKKNNSIIAEGEIIGLYKKE